MQDCIDSLVSSGQQSGRDKLKQGKKIHGAINGEPFFVVGNVVTVILRFLASECSNFELYNSR